MLTTKSELFDLFKNPNEFLACIEYTAGKTGFRSELIEKDFLCSLILMDVFESLDTPLVFKGGTLLAKIHAGFYRLSEDLDLSISLPHNISREKRSQMIRPFKNYVNSIPTRLGIFNVEQPLSGTNESKQYNARLGYQSQLSPIEGNILFEISIREEHQQESEIANANTVLEDFLTEKPYITPYPVKIFNKLEAYAEKMRAALTRTQPVIRDFYDLHFALKNKIIELSDPIYTNLVRSKLAITKKAPIDLSEIKLKKLQAQIATELLPTLSSKVENDFDLEKIFSKLIKYCDKLSS